MKKPLLSRSVLQLSYTVLRLLDCGTRNIDLYILCDPELGIATVKSHRRSIYRKFGVNRLTEFLAKFSR
ncbi:MAG: hypothetical protein AB1426_09885 [Bacillota bacterium]